MIELRISADSSKDLLAQLGGLTALLTGAPSTSAPDQQEALPKTSTARKKAEKEPASGSAETGAASGEGSATGTVTRADVSPEATAYGSRHDPEKLMDLFEKHGSTTRKFSGVPDENLGALLADIKGDVIAKA